MPRSPYREQLQLLLGRRAAHARAARGPAGLRQADPAAALRGRAARGRGLPQPPQPGQGDRDLGHRGQADHRRHELRRRLGAALPQAPRGRARRPAHPLRRGSARLRPHRPLAGQRRQPRPLLPGAAGARRDHPRGHGHARAAPAAGDRCALLRRALHPAPRASHQLGRDAADAAARGPGAGAPATPSSGSPRSSPPCSSRPARCSPGPPCRARRSICCASWPSDYGGQNRGGGLRPALRAPLAQDGAPGLPAPPQQAAGSLRGPRLPLAQGDGPARRRARWRAISIVRIHSGLTDPRRPYGVFLFTGPTGHRARPSWPGPWRATCTAMPRAWCGSTWPSSRRRTRSPG